MNYNSVQLKCFVLLVFLFSCKPRKSQNISSLNRYQNQCQGPIHYLPFALAHSECYKEPLESKRYINSWIPCNKVQLFTPLDSPADSNAGIQNWIASAPEFTPSVVNRMLKNPSVAEPESKNYPILSGPLHKALVQLIQNATESIFFDAFLFGGYWGTELARELVLASKRGVQVLFIRDTENPFGFRKEIDPLMEGLSTFALTAENFAVLRAQIHRRPSFLPAGLDNVIRPFFVNTNANNSPLMQSDHSKLIISDAFTSFPKMILGSKNLTDFGAAINFDEVVRIDGPAAGATALSYIPDVELAYALAQVEKKISPQASFLVKAWLDEAHGRRSGNRPALAEPVGLAEVRIAENNGDDSVRNVEHSIINLLESAKKSIKFYGLGMLPYNLEFTKAIARAIFRGVEVLPLLNSRLGVVVGLSFFDQLREFGAGANLTKNHSRWRELLPVKTVRDGWPNLDQQQHTKTILVDDETLFLGSANFDAATFEGAFREFSVAVRNTDAVSQALLNFNSVFENANLTLPANAFSEEKENRLANFSEATRNAAILNYLRIRGARVKLIEAEKTLPCGF